LGAACAALLDGVCPRYSVWPWLFLGSMTALCVFLVGVCGGAAQLLLAIVGVGVIIGLTLALIVTTKKRRRIPRSYRLPMEEWNPLLCSLVVTVLIAFVSANLPYKVKIDFYRNLESNNAFKLYDYLQPLLANTPMAASLGEVVDNARPVIGDAQVADTATLIIDGRRIPLAWLRPVRHPGAEQGLSQYLKEVGRLECYQDRQLFTCFSPKGEDLALALALSGFVEVMAGSPAPLTAAQPTQKKFMPEFGELRNEIIPVAQGGWNVSLSS